MTFLIYKEEQLFRLSCRKIITIIINNTLIQSTQSHNHSTNITLL